MILLTQQHNSCHVLSCFKKNSISSSGECRYLFPRVGGMETNIGGKHKLEIGRRFHHEYINPYNEVILSLICSNHDVRFLIGSGTTDALYYCMKYLTKTPPDVECLDALALSYFDRRNKIEEERKRSGVPYTSRSSGASRVKSIALAMSKMQQIAATMCAVYLRRHSGMFASHDFVPFHLGQTMAILEREEYEAVLVTGDEERMVQATQLNDYLYRPEIMNCMSMIDFITSYERVRNRRTEKVNPSVEARFMKEGGLIFSEGHPLRATHSLKNRPVPVVPDIIGPRLPDRTELQNSDERERFGLVAMVFTKPFTRMKPIREEGTTFWDAFLAFESSEEMTECRRIYLENFQEYYVSKAEAAEERRIVGNGTYENGEEEHLWDRHSVEGETGEDGVELVSNTFGTHAVTQARNDVSSSMSPSNRAVVNSAKTASCLNMITSSQHKKLNENIVWLGNEESGTEEAYCSDAYAAEIVEARMTVANSRQSGEDEAVTKNCSEQVEIIRNDEALELSQTQIGTSVEVLDSMENAGHPSADENGSKDDTLENRSTLEKRCLEQEKHQDFVSPDDVVKLFSLNHLQTVAFKEIVRRLLPRISDQSGDWKLGNTPFTMYLGGEGGTGKSGVIEAVTYFAKSWRKPGAVRICAPTGIAATLVKGQTFHSFAKIFARGNKSGRRKRTWKLVEEFRELHLVFVDEVSMLARKFIGRLDSFLREVKEVPDVLFGNVLVVFGGDFFQTPPVGSDPVYVDPDSSSYKCSFEDRNAFEIWRHSLDCVVMLEENMRQCEDKEYAHLLRRLRYGRLTEKDVDLLNTRVIGGESWQTIQTDFQQRKQSLRNIPMVVRGNELRTLLNWESVKRQAEVLELKPIVCVADLKTSTKGYFTSNDLQILFRTSDTQTANLAVLLPLLPGMPLRITQNVAIEIGIANGTEGTLVGVKFASTTTFEDAKIFGVECIVPSELPVVTFVELKGPGVQLCKRFRTIPKHCSNHTVPLVPVEVPNFSVKLGSLKLDAGNKLTIKQVPFVPAYASTTYKMQGATTDSIIAFPFLKGYGGNVPVAALYVVLSRVKSREGLFLFERITPEHKKYFVQCSSLLSEDKRLKQLHQRTLLKHSAHEVVVEPLASTEPKG